MTKYVLGFAFNDAGTMVLLMRKNKPEWQFGLLNGVGGKIEKDETPLQAMVREFEEETGVKTQGSNWSVFCEMWGDGFEVYTFLCREDDIFYHARTIESEPVDRYLVKFLGNESMVSNVPWLVHLALDTNYGRPFRVTANYSQEQPK